MAALAMLFVLCGACSTAPSAADVQAARVCEDVWTLLAQTLGGRYVADIAPPISAKLSTDEMSLPSKWADLAGDASDLQKDLNGLQEGSGQKVVTDDTSVVAECSELSPVLTQAESPGVRNSSIPPDLDAAFVCEDVWTIMAQKLAVGSGALNQNALPIYQQLSSDAGALTSKWADLDVDAAKFENDLQNGGLNAEMDNRAVETDCADLSPALEQAEK